MPFLYPSSPLPSSCSLYRITQRLLRHKTCTRSSLGFNTTQTRHESTLASSSPAESQGQETTTFSRLNPSPDDYGRSMFADKCGLTVQAGAGGHGCISFLRAKYISDGPPNGGDGGTGGSIYIQAVRSETSLHKLTRRRVLKAGRGKNGQGSVKRGQKGEDVLIQVPVGTVIREISRHDPVAEEDEQEKMAKMLAGQEQDDDTPRGRWRRDKWLMYPASLPSDYVDTEFPSLPRYRGSNLSLSAPPAPIYLDLSRPMKQPILLVAGALGGLGNPNFITRTLRKPKFASKGDGGTTVSLQMELKLLADVGFVGMPNAGKSTLLRALSNSSARVGDWAFTTLQPNLGTVVLDDLHGRPRIEDRHAKADPRTHISIADIPGLIRDAHLDRGLGLGFLRHVERAQILAFVIDLHAGDAIESLKILWRELREFEKQKDRETNIESAHRMVHWKSPGSLGSPASPHEPEVVFGSSGSKGLPALPMAPLSSKPWFVVATKADLDGTPENFMALRNYLDAVASGETEHPSGRENAWRGKLEAFPVSAIRGEGVELIPEWTLRLLHS